MRAKLGRPNSLSCRVGAETRTDPGSKAQIETDRVSQHNKREEVPRWRDKMKLSVVGSVLAGARDGDEASERPFIFMAPRKGRVKKGAKFEAQARRR